MVPGRVVAVSPAPGIGRIFHSLGVQELVVGGQTMNPSTAELLQAVERAPAPEVVILPNNSNIVAVAQRVDAESAKRVTVVPTAITRPPRLRVSAIASTVSAGSTSR